MTTSFAGWLLLVLASTLLSLGMLSLLLARGWSRRLRRLRRRLLGSAWKPVFIEPHRLPEPPRPAGHGK
jgi:hypothetical protein